LRRAFDPLLEDRTRVFGGREAILDKITGFIQDPKGGYLVITAPAGFGKTALMARLIKSTPDAFAYHFFTPLYGDDSLSEPFFLENVVEQMAGWHGHKAELPSGLDELRALYHEFLGKAPDKTQTLILDGLDEVTRWKPAPYLRRLPERLHLILTVHGVDQDWRSEYGLPGACGHLPLEGLDGQYCRSAARGGTPQHGRGPGPGARDRSRGRLPGRRGCADPFYGGSWPKTRWRQSRTRRNQETPAGLEAYLKEWWDYRGDGGLQPALSAPLTVALGPMPADRAIN
jgi:hypothetical protein